MCSPEVLRKSAEAANALMFVAGCTVEVQHERSRIRGGCRDVEKGVASAPQIEGIDAGFGAVTGDFGRARAEANGGLRGRTRR